MTNIKINNIKIDEYNDVINAEDLDLKKYNLPTILRKNIAYFNKNDSLRFLDYCRKKNIFILGIEGFKIKGNYIIPDINFIADFSDLYIEDTSDKVLKSIQYAKKFLSLPQNYEVMFEFVLTDGSKFK